MAHNDGCRAPLPSELQATCSTHKDTHKTTRNTTCALGGIFAQRGHSAGTAPVITVFIPGTPLKTTPLQKHARSIQTSIGGANFRTLGPVASIRLEKKILVYQQGLWGAEFKTLGPMATGDGKQPTFRTSRAQRTVRPHSSMVGFALTIQLPISDLIAAAPCPTKSLSLPGNLGG